MKEGLYAFVQTPMTNVVRSPDNAVIKRLSVRSLMFFAFFSSYLDQTEMLHP